MIHALGFTSGSYKDFHDMETGKKYPEPSKVVNNVWYL